MALGFPRDLRTGLYLGGEWQDVSSDVRQSDTVTITHARKDESPRPSPSRAAFILDDGPEHGNGDYDPGNPAGPWFGQLGENTPVRQSLRHGRDTVTRTVAASWGTSDDMGAYLTFSSGTTAHDTTGTAARHSISTTTSFRADYLEDVSAKNVDAYVEFQLPSVAAATGGAIEPANLLVRGTSTYYMMRTTIETSGVILVLLFDETGASLDPVVFPGPAYPGAGVWMAARMQAEDATLRGKVWILADGEPLRWNAEASIDGTVLGAGWVGVRTGVAGGNTNTKPVQVLYDNLTVEFPRFAGECSKVEPLTEVDHANRRTKIEALGLLNRLSKGKKVLDSVFYRYITGGGLPFTVTDFWPLDYDPQIDHPGRNVVGPYDVAFVQSTGGSLKWGTDTGLLPVKRAVTMVPPGTGHSGQMFAAIDSSRFTAAAGHAVFWLQRLGSDREGAVVVDLTVGQLYLHFTPGLATLQLLPAATTVMTVGVPQVGDDTVWHMIALGCKQSGASAVFQLTIDGFPYEVTLGATTVGVPEGMQWAAFPETVEGYEVTQAIVINQAMFTGAPWPVDLLRDVYLGRTGESPGERIGRLCTEQDVSYMLNGDPAGSPALGPQRPLTFMDLITETVDVDQGVIHDSRGAPSLSVRLLGSMLNQDPAFTLDYSNEEVAPEFKPTFDTQGTLNDVTAKRPNGGEARFEQATGAKNTADPGTAVGAVGRTDTTVNPNVATDADLPDQAGWRVHLGTVDEPRYPTVTVNMAADAVAGNVDLTQAIMDATVGDMIMVTGATARRIYDDVRQIVRGYTETFRDQTQHMIAFNTTPASAYDAAIADDTVDSAVDSATTVTNEDLTTTEPDLTVFTLDISEIWPTTAEKPSVFPFDIIVTGERMTVTAITGSTGVQTMTVTRSVNGVVKTHAINEPVHVFRPTYAAP